MKVEVHSRKSSPTAILHGEASGYPEIEPCPPPIFERLHNNLEVPSCRPSRKSSLSTSSSLSRSLRTINLGGLTLLHLALTIILLIDLYASPTFLFAAAAKGSSKKKVIDETAVKSKCTVCRSLVKKFLEGLEKTKKSGYGGGNTAWEEKSLGKNSFAKSETRFVEIMDRVCEDISGETDKFYCGNIVELHEEDIEDWFKSDQESEELESTLCVKSLKVCCPHGSWGPECAPCTDGTSVFCNGRGKCKGNGTRVGDGKCECEWPYQGDRCAECRSGYFFDSTQSNGSHAICEKCDQACGSDGCKGPQASNCIDCASGYKMAELAAGEDPKGCLDMDECENNPCSTSEYCVNSAGSYTCNKCDKICDPDSGCTGGGASDCVSCRLGAEWDADRKNCVVTDWEKYDGGLKEEAADEDLMDNDSDGDDEDRKAEVQKKLEELEELKAKLRGGERTGRESEEAEDGSDQAAEAKDAPFDEPVTDEHASRDEL